MVFSAACTCLAIETLITAFMQMSSSGNLIKINQTQYIVKVFEISRDRGASWTNKNVTQARFQVKILRRLLSGKGGQEKMTPPQQLHSNINDLLNVEGQRFSIYSLEQWTKLRAVTLSVRSPEVVGTWVTNGQVRNKISPEGGTESHCLCQRWHKESI